MSFEAGLWYTLIPISLSSSVLCANIIQDIDANSFVIPGKMENSRIVAMTVISYHQFL